VPRKVTPQGTTTKLPLYLKAAVLVVAAAFLGYCIYWLVQDVFWGYQLTYIISHVNQISIMSSMGAGELLAIFVQEFSSVVSGFVLFFCGVFAFQSALRYLKGNEKYFAALRRSLVLLAVFSLLLIPASLHHFLGVAFGWTMVDFRVGLSYLLQALLIVPPLLIMSQKMRTPQNPPAIKKWACIAAPTYVFALYFKYVLLWLDALVLLGSKEASAASTVGAANSLVTLLVAGVVTVAGCYGVLKAKPWGRKVAASAVILVGAFFVIYSLVALFVPVYASFWYLTDFWMVSLPVLGAAILVAGRKPK
jgi:hypothetical protein